MRIAISDRFATSSFFISRMPDAGAAADSAEAEEVLPEEERDRAEAMVMKALKRGLWAIRAAGQLQIA